jgi:threonine aldolase
MFVWVISQADVVYLCLNKVFFLLAEAIVLKHSVQIES